MIYWEAVCKCVCKGQLKDKEFNQVHTSFSPLSEGHVNKGMTLR